MNRFLGAVVSGANAFLSALFAPNFVETGPEINRYRDRRHYRSELDAHHCVYPLACGCPEKTVTCKYHQQRIGGG